MISEQILIGGLLAAMGIVGLWQAGWLLEETPKGRRLVTWFGDATALWLLRCLLTLGIGFGLLLAAGVVNPVQWTGQSARTAE